MRPLLGKGVSLAILILTLSWGGYLLWPPMSAAQLTVEARISNSRHNIMQYAQKASALMDQGRYPEAIEWYKLAIQLNPASAATATLYNNLALAYRRSGQYDLALSSLHRAIRLQPHFELYYKNLLDCYEEAGQTPSAMARWQTLLEENPENGEIWFLLGLVYERQGFNAEAQSAFEKYLELEPYSRMAEAARHHLAQ